MFKLNTLKDNKGSKRISKALGRGIGSGKGKTAGRGGKGQTARSGVAIGFNEGGQTRLYMRLPKRGFKNFTRVEYQVVNLWQLQDLLDKNYITANDTIDKKLLETFGITSGKKPLKLLAEGEINTPLKIIVDKASKKAQDLVKAAGGEVIINSNK